MSGDIYCDFLTYNYAVVIPEPIHRLRLRQFVPPGSWYHIARGVYPGSAGGGLHTHDFAEVFWIESGRGWHLINGERLPLDLGDLVLVRPDDRHGFRGAGAQRMTLVNVAFDHRLLDPLRERCFGPDNWPWAGDALPTARRVAAATLGRLTQEAQRLAAARRTRLALERFLLTLLDELVAEPAMPLAEGLPDWLATGLRTMRDDPQALLDGVPALARLTGRTREHIARTVRQRQDRTATELVNAVRLERADQLLAMTDRPIVDVAIDAGLPNLGHFYQLFKARFGQTPRRRRLAAQAVLR